MEHHHIMIRWARQTSILHKYSGVVHYTILLSSYIVKIAPCCADQYLVKYRCVRIEVWKLRRWWSDRCKAMAYDYRCTYLLIYLTSGLPRIAFELYFPVQRSYFFMKATCASFYYLVHIIDCIYAFVGKMRSKTVLAKFLQNEMGKQQIKEFQN